MAESGIGASLSLAIGSLRFLILVVECSGEWTRRLLSLYVHYISVAFQPGARVCRVHQVSPSSAWLIIHPKQNGA